jgi:hypothetical protein
MGGQQGGGMMFFVIAFFSLLSRDEEYPAVFSFPFCVFCAFYGK